MIDIRVPKLNNNDDVYILLEWLVDDEQSVMTDTPLAIIETSKAAEDLPCPADGTLVRTVAEGAECAPGQVIGQILPSGTARHPTGKPDLTPVAHEDAGPRRTPEAPATSDCVITAPARTLIERSGIDLGLVYALGRKIVRASDIEELLESRTNETATPTETAPRRYTTSAAQQAVARTVIRSRREIPAAYTVTRVDVGAALAVARRLGERLNQLVDLPEMLIAAVAPLSARFPQCFAHPIDDQTAHLPDAAHIGVTVDVGRGLFVPVIHDASALDLERIVAALASYRHTAMHGSFRERDLTGANIAVTLHTDPEVVVAIPVVFPGHTCALALGGTRREPTLNSANPAEPIGSRTVTDLGLAYDHRFVSGRDAIRFLKAIKAAIESPQDLAV